MKTRYDATLKVMPKTEYRDEVFFRVAGDEFLKVSYGKAKIELSIEEKLLNIFRIIIVNDKVKSANIPGLIETVPGGRTNLYKFDPLTIDIKSLIDEIKVIESEVKSVEDLEFETRLVRLPLAFDDSGIRETIEKYVKEIKPNAPNCKNGSNLEYVASYNGITVKELKQKIIKTEWLLSMIGFYPGCSVLFPLNPTCAITAPKYNPSRTSSPANLLDLADYSTSIMPVETAGGYQLIGRTAPILQWSQKHPQFKEGILLCNVKDIIQYYEVSEGELHEIFRWVAEGKGWEYNITERRFSLKEWFRFCEEVKDETKEFKKKQEQGRKGTPLP